MAFTGFDDRNIPPGKKVKISDISNIFVLDGDLTLSISSNYSPLLSGNASATLNAVSGVFSNFGVNVGTSLKIFGFEVWTGSQPISANCSVIINMKDNAYDDVVKPVLKLCQNVLPSENSLGMLIPPGPTILDALNGAGGLTGEAANAVTNFASQHIASYRSKSLTISVGKFNFTNVLLTKADPSFSPEVDEMGYPIKATVDLSFQTLYYGSKDQLYGLVGRPVTTSTNIITGPME